MLGVKMAEQQQKKLSSKKQACVSRWISKLVDEGVSRDQAIARAFRKCGVAPLKKKKSNPSHTEKERRKNK